MGSRCLTSSAKLILRSCTECSSIRYGSSSFHVSFQLPKRQVQKRQLARLQYTRKHPQRSGGLSPRAINSSTQVDELRAVDRLGEVLQDALQVLESPAPPSERAVVESLRTCERIARYFRTDSDSKGSEPKTQDTPAMNLLFLDEKDEASKSSSRSATALAKAIKDQAITKISDVAYKIVTSPKVFITPRILELYVNIMSLLGRPETLSQVFSLYAKKPVPQPNTSPIQFTSPSPNAAASAVPMKIATTAMDAAIEVKNLPLCLDILNTTVCAPAFRRSKILKKAVVPLIGFSLAPLAAYTVASQLSMYQDTMSPEMATNIAFAGIIAYVGLTATTGIVAVTTANDQMDRVTWATGMPLRERWLREEERAMIDRVAGAWGFKEPWRRGEEEGQDWAALKEFTGLKGMVLDRVELMEGME
ncbi:hypothetical protein MMC30_000822 [Trapelia coarctata]|nr:hypothetical protein [Trapelia coarctata]